MKKLLFVLSTSILLIACQQKNTTPIEETTVDLPSQNEINEETEELKISSAHLLLSPALFKAKLDNKEDNVVLIDVRTSQELAESGKIEDAINIDFYASDFEQQIKAIDVETPIMIYCRSGNRSGQAAAMLKEWGYKQVYDLKGGFLAWTEANY